MTSFSVGTYRSIRHLSVSRAGDLYLAVHEPSGKRVVVRRLAKEVSGDPDLVDSLLDGLHRVSTISHPNIVAIREIIRDQSDLYVVMDHVDGVNLATILKHLRATSALSPPVAAFIALQICHGLDHAHRLTDQGHPDPLVHGTLWPPNVLVSRRGEVLISDFGSWVIPAAMQREGGAYSIRTQFSYRSPEHVNGDTLTCATDIFCVGILLYEMLSARPPFLGSTLLDTLELVETAKLDSLDHIPPSLQSVLSRCLAQDPRHRFTNAAGLISELSVAVPGAGGREARQELASFVQSLIPADAGAEDAAVVVKIPAEETTEETTAEEPKVILSPEPIDESGAKPLSPIPGLDRETDEPTHINPTEVTEALAALSKDATDPGNLDQIVLDGEDEEPTRIDPIIPGITGPPSEETDLEGPTNVVPPAEAKLLWGADEQTVPVPGTVPGTEQDETTTPYSSLFPDEKPTDPVSPIPGIVGMDTDEKHLEEEELTEPTAPEPAIPRRNLTFTVDEPDDEPTHPTSVEETTEGAVPMGQDLTKDEDEPTVQSARPNAMTLLGVGESATPAPPPLEAQPQRPPKAEPVQPLPAPPKAEPVQPLPAPPKVQPVQPLPAPLKVQPVQPLPAPLNTEPPPPTISPPAPAPAVPPVKPKWGEDSAPSLAGLVNLPPTQPQPQPLQSQPGEPDGSQPLSFIPSEPGFASDVDSEFSTYDGGNVVSVTFDKPTRRFTAAHLLLLIAIVVFLVAIGLLLRRLMMGTSIDHRPAGSLADASADLPPPHETKRPAVDARRSPDATKPKVHESGEHLKHLLHGKIPRGSMKITSTPPGDVYVNRKLLGRSPVTAKARPGSTPQVVVIANTFKVHRQQVKLPEDKGLNLDIRLEKGFYPRATGRRRGWLSIRCWGRIKWRFSLNGKDTGYGCPRVILRLKPGRYMVGFISPYGNKVRKRRVRIRWGRKVRLRSPRK